MTLSEYEAPCGRLLLGVRDGSLCLCSWIDGPGFKKAMGALQRRLPFTPVAKVTDLARTAAKELDEYFAGARQSFGLPLSPYGTQFQREVWEALLGVPYGATASYKAIAKSMSRPGAVRAVANAIAVNPIAVFIPCHRIIGSDGSPAGYAGGIPAKLHLLHLENKIRVAP